MKVVDVMASGRIKERCVYKANQNRFGLKISGRHAEADAKWMEDPLMVGVWWRDVSMSASSSTRQYAPLQGLGCDHRTLKSLPTGPIPPPDEV
jgi:hypothetical protein